MSDDNNHDDFKPLPKWKSFIPKANAVVGYAFAASSVIAGVYGLARGKNSFGAGSVEDLAEIPVRAIAAAITAAGLVGIPFAKANWDTASHAQAADKKYAQLGEKLKNVEAAVGRS